MSRQNLLQQRVNFLFTKNILHCYTCGSRIAQSTTTKAAADPLESLFNNAPNKPVINRESDQDDIFSTKPSAQPKAQARNDSFESLFGPSSINDNSTSAYSNSRQYASQNDKLQRPKLVTNVAKPTSNRTVVDELEDFS